MNKLVIIPDLSLKFILQIKSPPPPITFSRERKGEE